MIKRRASLLFPFFLVLFEMAAYMSNDAYLPALPRLAHDLLISQDEAMYTVTVWFFAISGFGLWVGPISNRLGRRPVLLFGMLLFCLGTLFCMSTHDYRLFLCGRFLEGLSINTVSVAGYASIHELYDTRMSIRVITVMMAVTLLAPACGPVLGAWCIMEYDWRMIFFFLLFIGCVSMVGLWYKMPESLTNKSAFNIMHAMRSYRNLVQNSAFMYATISIGLVFFILILWIVELPFIISATLSLPPVYYGWAQAIVFGMMLVSSVLVNFVYKSCRIDRVVFMGYVILTVGVALLLIMSVYLWSWWYCVYAMSLVAFGSSFIIGAFNRLAVEMLPKEALGYKTALISAVTGFCCFAGSYVITLVNDKTFLSLSLPMVCVTVLMLLIYKRQYQTIRRFFAKCA